MTFLLVWVWIAILPQIKIWNKPEIKKKIFFRQRQNERPVVQVIS